MNVVDGSTYFERAVGNDHKMFKGGLSTILTSTRLRCEWLKVTNTLA